MVHWSWMEIRLLERLLLESPVGLSLAQEQMIFIPSLISLILSGQNRPMLRERLRRPRVQMDQSCPDDVSGRFLYRFPAPSARQLEARMWTLIACQKPLQIRAQMPLFNTSSRFTSPEESFDQITGFALSLAMYQAADQNLLHY